MFEIRLIASAALLAIASLLMLIGRRLEQKQATSDNALAFILLLAVLWIPREWRDLGLAVLAGLLGMLSGFATGLVIGSITFGVAMLIPGGGTAVLLLLVAVIAFFVGREERSQLADVKRATTLVPGDTGQLAVGIIGTTTGAGVALPGDGTRVAAWWAKLCHEHDTVGKAQSDIDIHIESGDGRARLVLGNEIFDLDHAETDVRDDQPTELLKQIAFEPAEKPDGEERVIKEEDSEPSLHLSWLPLGASVFVRGVPTWEADRAGGGYRDTAFVPVFRGTEDSPVTVKLGTLQELKRRIKYSAIHYATWSIPCLAASVAQFGFGF